MPRIRNVKPEFFNDPDVADLPPLCRLFYIGLWVHADKMGRVKECARTLRAQILPYEGIEAIKLVEGYIDILAKDKKYSNRKRPFVRRYTGEDGERMLEILSFTEHQYANPKERESKLPAPPHGKRHAPYPEATPKDGSPPAKPQADLLDVCPTCAMAMFGKMDTTGEAYSKCQNPACATKGKWIYADLHTYDPKTKASGEVVDGKVVEAAAPQKKVKL